MKFKPVSGLMVLALLTVSIVMSQAASGNATSPSAEPIADFGPVGAGGGIARPGAIVWMDLLTGDVKRAANFYHKVFDWDFRFSPDNTYAYATHDGHPVAAIAAFDDDSDGADGIWLPSISNPGVDKAMAVVKSNGGKVIGLPEDLPGRGRYVLIEDAAGAALMLLHAEGGDPERLEAPNQWLWAELWTDNMSTATGFYEAVAGYRTVAVKDPEGQQFMVMGRDQQAHASVVKTPLPDVDPTWLTYLRIDDVIATCNAILKAGGSIVVAPQKDGFNDDIAIVADPTGGVFALQQKETKL